MCMNVLAACIHRAYERMYECMYLRMYIHTTCACCSQKPEEVPEEGHRSSRTWVGYESPCECWKSNLGPLEEQLVLLIAKPSLLYPQLFFSSLVNKTAGKRDCVIALAAYSINLLLGWGKSSTNETKTDSLSLIPVTHSAMRKPTPINCSLIYTHSVLMHEAQKQIHV